MPTLITSLKIAMQTEWKMHMTFNKTTFTQIVSRYLLKQMKYDDSMPVTDAIFPISPFLLQDVTLLPEGK